MSHYWKIEEYRKEYPRAEAVETTSKHEGWSKYFQYYELRLNDSKNSVYYFREAREGYEKYDNDHRTLVEIELELNNP